MSALKKKKSTAPAKKKSRAPLKSVRRVAVKPKVSKAKARSENLKPVVARVASKVPVHVLAVVKALDDKKAESIRVLELGQLSSVADYMIIATGNSDPHLRALRIEVERALDEAGSPARGTESQKESGWTVVDGFDVVVHVFRPDVRESYSMESLWRDGLDLSVKDLLKA
ncbi:MAG: ribosome silencing factor [bacterium]